ncbi:flagellar biosynthetic protein FliO [Cryobacterium sp. TMT2-18-3]|uniref:FliO/MopB family protein n=1 Tax=unclassified Cryobacterium TaxID=2649013 RepID=UPI00106A8F12|nr:MULTISPECIES: flagellar biosynthetic protein FliO [unclassified Cryobacterium]TFC30951.1 flagellar biosynthetic protein FliO [Cryobacterium sp. TMT2-18-2]TFC63354.1 flagellar biosynthetic protein FliO [Cryobacterium sp. TMT2-18-3]
MDTILVALRVALSLAAVLGLLWVLQRKLTKGTLGGRTPNLVTVVGRQGVGQKASVVVVDIEGRRFVLGVTEQSVSVLHDGQAPTDAAAPLPAPLTAALAATLPGRRGHHPAADFARELDQATHAAHAGAPHDGEELTPPLILRPRRDRATPGRIGGSILSPATWQQTAAALRQGR